MNTDITCPSPSARQLGFAGLIPFVGLAMALWLSPPESRPWLSMALLGYGASIASFLGAIHWGLVMRGDSPRNATSLIWGVMPSLLAWLALLLGQATGVLLILGLLCACYAVDRTMYPRYQLKAWLSMRLQLTLVASASCLAGTIALLRQLSTLNLHAPPRKPGDPSMRHKDRRAVTALTCRVAVSVVTVLIGCHPLRANGSGFLTIEQYLP